MKALTICSHIVIPCTISFATIVSVLGVQQAQSSKQSKIELFDKDGRLRISLDANAPLGPSVDLHDDKGVVRVRMFSKNDGSKGAGWTVFDEAGVPRILASAAPEPEYAGITFVDSKLKSRVLMGTNGSEYAGISVRDSDGVLSVEIGSDKQIRGDVFLMNEASEVTKTLSGRAR